MDHELDFTVTLRFEDGSEMRYAANNLTTYLGDWKTGDSVPLVSFKCSGRLQVAPASQVVKIELHVPKG